MITLKNSLWRFGRWGLVARLFGRLPENSLVVEAPHGLGNRLGALNGAIMLARAHARQLYFAWPVNNACGSRFDELFECSADNFKLITHQIRTYYSVQWRVPRVLAKINAAWGLWASSACQKALLYLRYGFDYHLGTMESQATKHRIMNTKSRIYMRAWNDFYRLDNPSSPPSRFEYLRPASDIQARIDAVASDFGPKVIGVHIRRGDAPWWVRRRSLVSAFVALMREEIKRDAEVCFYLASESSSVIKRFKVLFGSRIITQAEATRDRDSIDGMKSAVVDMWALSRTQKVIGSFGSTFSEVAAQIGGVELHQVNVLAPE